jgi:hypothetical protein
MTLRHFIERYACKSLDYTFDKFGTAVDNTPKLAEHILFLLHQLRVTTHEKIN